MAAEESLDVSLQRENQFLQTTLSVEGSNLSWGRDRLQSYLRELQILNPASDVRVSFSPADVPDRIIQWIEKYDQSLDLFSKHHLDFETSRAKAIGVFQMPTELTAFRPLIQQGFSEKSFSVRDLISAQQSVDKSYLIQVSIDEPIISTVAAESTFASSKRRVSITGLTLETQENIRSLIGYDARIQSVLVDVTTETRAVSAIKLDFERQTVQIATDTFKSSGNEETLQKRFGSRFKRSMAYILRTAGVDSGSADSIVEMTVDRPLINGDLARRFRLQQRQDLLVVPFSVTHTKGTEEVPNRFRERTSAVIMRFAREFYKRESTLLGFFTEHPEFDDRHCELLRTIQGVNGVREEGCSCLVVFPRNARNSDPRHRSWDNDDIILDSISVTFDPSEGVVHGNSKENTTERLDAVLSEIYRLL